MSFSSTVLLFKFNCSSQSGRKAQEHCVLRDQVPRHKPAENTESLNPHSNLFQTCPCRGSCVFLVHHWIPSTVPDPLEDIPCVFTELRWASLSSFTKEGSWHSKELGSVLGVTGPMRDGAGAQKQAAYGHRSHSSPFAKSQRCSLSSY